jgi:hypothetical protein
MARKPQTVVPATNGTYDNCYTPPWALWAIVDVLPPNSVIWEPCCGADYLGDALRYLGHTVISSDIATGTDLFTAPTPPGVRYIITNPAYSIKRQVIMHLLSRGIPWALLVPYDTTASVMVRRAFGALISMERTYLEGRVNFEMPIAKFTGNGSQFPVMWLSWKITGASEREGSTPHRLSFERKMREVLDMRNEQSAAGKTVRVMHGRHPTRDELFSWSGFGPDVTTESAQLSLF